MTREGYKNIAIPTKVFEVIEKYIQENEALMSKVKTPPGAWRVAINSDQSDLDLIESQVELTVPCGEGYGSGMDPERGAREIQEVLDLVPEIVKGACAAMDYDEPDLIPVFSCLGHGFGSGATSPFLETLKREFPRSVLMPFIVLPFRAEGSGVRGRARRAFTKLVKGGEFTIFPISNDVVGKQLGIQLESLPITKIYETINSEVSHVISTFVDSLTAKEGIVQAFDKSDLEKIIEGQIGTLTSKRVEKADRISPETVREIDERRWIKTVSLTGRRRKRLRGTYIVDGAGKFTVRQLWDLTNTLKDEHRVDVRWLKPCIIEREKPCDFLLLKAGFKCKVAGGVIHAQF